MTGSDRAPLLVRFGRVGDMVMQAPLLALLHRRYGTPVRVLASGHWSSQLYARHPDVAEVRELQGRHTPYWLSPERQRAVRWLRGHQGPVYVSEDIPRQVAKIRKMVDRARLPASHCVFLADRPPTGTHWVDRLLAFGALTPDAFRDVASPPPSFLEAAPRLRPDEFDRADCMAWLEARGMKGRPIVLLQPANRHVVKRARRAGGDPKAWPVANWAALAMRIHAAMPEARLLLCGAPPEEALLDEIVALAEPCPMETATEDLPLRRFLALAAIAHSMVAVDTGPAHIAAAVGCPLVVLYGSESPQVWSRRSVLGRPVVELGGPPLSTSASAISLDEVFAAWKLLAA